MSHGFGNEYDELIDRARLGTAYDEQRSEVAEEMAAVPKRVRSDTKKKRAAPVPKPIKKRTQSRKSSRKKKKERTANPRRRSSKQRVPSTKEVKKLSDTDLESQWSSAYHAARGESYGRDYEAHADAIQWYEMLDRERQRRRVAA